MKQVLEVDMNRTGLEPLQLARRRALYQQLVNLEKSAPPVGANEIKAATQSPQASQHNSSNFVQEWQPPSQPESRSNQQQQSWSAQQSPQNGRAADSKPSNTIINEFISNDESPQGGDWGSAKGGDKRSSSRSRHRSRTGWAETDDSTCKDHADDGWANVEGSNERQHDGQLSASGSGNIESDAWDNDSSSNQGDAGNNESSGLPSSDGGNGAKPTSGQSNDNSDGWNNGPQQDDKKQANASDPPSGW